MKQFFYVSGLPRSGSTLLVNILHQNPDFCVSKSTSGLHDVLFGVRNQYDALIEHKAEVGGMDYLRLKRLLTAIQQSYYDTDKPYIIDKGRGWLSLIEMVKFMGDDNIKILAPVRDVTEILASFENLWRKSTGQSQWSFEREDYIKSQTVEGRCEIWTRGDQVVGLAYNRLKDALQRGYSKNIHLVEFDDLTNNPKETFEKIYNFFELDTFKHDFNNVVQYTQEDDIGVHRIPGLHDIQSVVKPLTKKGKQVLGDAVFTKYLGCEFWRYNK